MQRADARPSKNCTPKTVRFFFPSAVMSATRHSIRSPVSCAPVIRALSTRHIARHRPFKTAVASHGAPARPGEPPRYTGLDVIIVRDEKIAALYVTATNKISASLAIANRNTVTGLRSTSGTTPPHMA